MGHERASDTHSGAYAGHHPRRNSGCFTPGAVGEPADDRFSGSVAWQCSSFRELEKLGRALAHSVDQLFHVASL